MRKIDSQFYFCMLLVGRHPCLFAIPFPQCSHILCLVCLKVKLRDSAPCKNELSNLSIIFMFIFLHFNMVFLKINYDVKCK